MKALLGSLLVLATFMTSCNAQCFIIPMERGPGDSPTECRDPKGTTHSMNSEWATENCEECSCHEDGIHCCNIAAIPVDYDKIKCRSYFHKDNCTYTVVEREDPGKPCVVHAWVL